MTDRFQNTSSGISGPAFDAFNITPNDATDLSEVTRTLYIGGAGDITLTTKEGTQVTFSSLNAGSLLPIRATKVHATGTTATNILGLV